MSDNTLSVKGVELRKLSLLALLEYVDSLPDGDERDKGIAVIVYHVAIRRSPLPEGYSTYLNVTMATQAWDSFLDCEENLAKVAAHGQLLLFLENVDYLSELVSADWVRMAIERALNYHQVSEAQGGWRVLHQCLKAAKLEPESRGISREVLKANVTQEARELFSDRIGFFRQYGTDSRHEDQYWREWWDLIRAIDDGLLEWGVSPCDPVMFGDVLDQLSEYEPSPAYAKEAERVRARIDQMMG